MQKEMDEDDRLLTDAQHHLIVGLGGLVMAVILTGFGYVSTEKIL